MNRELKEAITLFELRIPFTEEDVKIKFRNLAKQYHSDITHNSSTDDMMAKINSAYDTLKAYLKDPSRIAEEARKETERKRQEAERRQKEREEYLRRQEEEKLRQEEERRQKAAYEKIQREKFETRISNYRNINLFNSFCISERDYRYEEEKRKELDTLYKFTRKCMNNVEDYVERYKKKHKSDSLNELTQNLKIINSYKKSLKDKFKDLPTAVITVSNAYAEYFLYGEVFGKINLSDLEEYIFMDDKEKNKFKKASVAKLKEYAELQSNFLTPLEQIEMAEIDPANRFKDYTDEIGLQKEIEQFVKENYIFGNDITANHNSPIYATRILNSFRKFNHDNQNEYNLRLFISNIFNMAIRIKEKIPMYNNYDIEDNFRGVATLSRDYDKLIRLYKMTQSKNFNTLYAYYLNIRYYDYNKGKTIYEIFDLISERLGNLPLLKHLYLGITPDELFKMTDTEYKMAIAYANKSKESGGGQRRS